MNTNMNIKWKRFFSLLLSLVLLGSLLSVPVFATEEKTLTLREDWRLTADLDLNVPAETNLTIQGDSYYIYEMGGRLLNSGEGTVTFAEGTILYPADSNETCTTETSNTLMTNRKAYKITITPADGGTVTASRTVALPEDTITLTVTPTNGYQVGSLKVTYGENQSVDVNNRAFVMPAGDVTVTAAFEPVSGGSGGGGGSSPSSATTEVITNPDGSTTTKVTNTSTGTVTETTKRTDGSTEVVETKKDGSVKTTITDRDGASSVTSVSADGQSETVVKLPASVISAAEEKGELIALPMPEISASKDRETAPLITADFPSGTSARVEIPVRDADTGTVAVLVREDGTEEIILTSLPAENGISVILQDGDTVKITDNSKSFADVAEDYWGAEAIGFVTAREIFKGTGEDTFAPESSMTRAMILTVLARCEGVDTAAGGEWYESGVQWAVENGISDGTDLNAPVTREQLVTMLYRYAGEPEIAGSIGSFSDTSAVSSWAEDAIIWAVENGIMEGMGNGMLKPQETATRVQVAAILQRFLSL